MIVHDHPFCPPWGPIPLHPGRCIYQTSNGACGELGESHAHAAGPMTHPFTSGPYPDRCYHWYSALTGVGGGFYCTRSEREHMVKAGQSPLGDGPVRSTVERLQEKLAAAERGEEQLRQVNAALQADVVSLRAQRQVLMDSERALALRLRNLSIPWRVK